MKYCKSIFAYWLLTIVLCWSCTDHELHEESQTMLFINVYVPTAQLTRAEVSPIAAQTYEKTVHSLQIWVFNHESVTLDNGSTLPAGALIAYMNPSVNDLQSGTAQRFAVAIDNLVARRSPNVDVFVVANSESIGRGNFSESATREELKAITFSGEYFGIPTPTSHLTQSGDIVDLGLPMSGILTNVAMRSDKAPMYEIETVTMQRAVSKLRFVLCQADNDLAGMFTLDEIRLDGGAIVSEEYLINDTPEPFKFVGGNYESRAIVLDGSSNPTLPAFSQLPVCSRPTEYIYTNQAAQTYENTIDQGVANGKLHQMGPFYLRETDRVLSGTISYHILNDNGSWEAKTAHFSMANAGDFARNHSWIVYAYFLGGNLYVKPTVLPWNAATERFTYSTQGSTTMEWNSYLRYDIDQKSNTWGDTYVAVAYGYRNNATHEPLYSTPISLKTTNANELWIQVDNDNFQLIKKQAASYEVMGQRIVIEAGSEATETEFYVVPISSENPSNPVTKVTVTARPTTGAPPYNIPFNHDLPGDEDHTSILIYNIGAQTYNANQGNMKLPGSEQGKQYWIESNV